MSDPTLYFTPAAITYMALLQLSALITFYLIWRARPPGLPAYVPLLIGFFSSLTAFIATLFLESCLLPSERMIVVFLENPFLALSLAFLTAFAYHFPFQLPALRLQSRIAIAWASLYALLECAFSIYRFASLNAGQIVYRESWNDNLLIVTFLVIPASFLRQAIKLHRGGQPQKARTVGKFALIFLFVGTLPIVSIYRDYSQVSIPLANLFISLGLVLAVFLFAVTYLYSQPGMTSFLVRISGVTLTLQLAITGTLGWVITPAFQTQFHPAIQAGHSLRFSPNQLGGYDISPIPYAFANELGRKLPVDDSTDHECSPALPFSFPFYRQTYSSLFACNDGTISMGQAVPFRAYQYHYGMNRPVIFALLIDLVPDPQSSTSGVFANPSTERLVITWMDVAPYYNRASRYTFQAVLYPSGVFELSYQTLPTAIHYQADNEPSANIWLVGSVPGSTARPPQRIRLANAALQTGPDGALEDYFFGFRSYLNQILAPLALAILVGTLLILLVFPALFYSQMVQPLLALINGVQRMETGDLSTPVAVRTADEIGYLTGAFNQMMNELNSQIATLSDKVAERTAELANKVTELATRNEELDAFAHTVAHDIRGPVANVASYAHWLAGNHGPMNPQESVLTARAILQSTERLSRITEDLLLLAGLRSIETQPETLNMAAILLEAHSRLKHTFAETGAWLELPEDFAWPLALGQPTWVEEIWVNYLSNACRYGRLGEQPAHITVGADLNAGPGLVRFWVRDEGKGLTAAEQAQLFTPFTRLNQAHTKGHGLGLSIVRRIAEKLGGGVSVESSPIPSQGSLFAFTLPAAPPNACPPAAPEPELDILPGAFTLRGLRILLVDDDTSFAESMRSLLSARGLSVVGIAHDGEEAQTLARGLNPELILMDIDMPRLDGLQAARALKAAQPSLKIAMLTALERDETLFEALRGGASGYLLKGAPVEVFIAQLAALARGEVPLSSGLAERVLAELSQTRPPENIIETPSEDDLSAHQWEILTRVANGQTYKEIGISLHLSEKTIKYHMGQIVDKLHVSTRSQAINHLRRSQRAS